MGRWINKIGVEIEIEVDPTTDDLGNSVSPQIEGFTATGDGSISARDGGRAVEYVSKAFEYHHDGIPPLEAGVQDLYERHNARANSTMGLHIHVSFVEDFYYYALASMRFYDFFMRRVRDSALYDRCPDLRRRVDGVHYAQPIESHRELDRSLKKEPTGENRYRHFIYRPRKQTIEFRLFPAMDRAADVLAAVDLVCSTINAYLGQRKYELDEETVLDVETADLIDGNEQVVEEVVQYV